MTLPPTVAMALALLLALLPAGALVFGLVMGFRLAKGKKPVPSPERPVAWSNTRNFVAPKTSDAEDTEEPMPALKF